MVTAECLTQHLLTEPHLARHMGASLKQHFITTSLRACMAALTQLAGSQLRPQQSLWALANLCQLLQSASSLPASVGCPAQWLLLYIQLLPVMQPLHSTSPALIDCSHVQDPLYGCQ